MSGRSRLIFALGVVVAAAGAVLVYQSLAEPSAQAGADGVEVLIAAKPIPAGTTGANAASQGMVEGRKVPATSKPAEALTEVSQLAGRVAAEALEPGAVLTSQRFPMAQTRLGTLRIPPDKTALAVHMSNVPGVAGFAGAGDKIDIYGVAKEGPGGGPTVRLILPGIEVLNVNGGTVAPAQGKPDAPGLVFLLAVTPPEAERLVYLASFEQLYFSLAPRDRPALAPTPGIGADDLRAA